MASAQARGHAGGVHGRVVHRIFRQSCHRVHIRRRLQHRLKICRVLSRRHLHLPLVVSTRDVIQLEGKLIVLNPRQRIGQFVDRVLRPWQRTVAARIRRRQHKIAIKFFGGVHFHHQGLAMIRQYAAAIVVKHELSINQFAMILNQPVHTVRRASFFVRRHRKNNVAVGHVAFFLHAD